MDGSFQFLHPVGMITCEMIYVCRSFPILGISRVNLVVRFSLRIIPAKTWKFVDFRNFTANKIKTGY